MTFPIELKCQIVATGKIQRSVTLHRGVTLLLGPNGSGKTQLLRGMKQALANILPKEKKVYFLSAGRIGPLENYRSDFDGHRSGQPLYEQAMFGSKGDVPRRHQIETLNGVFQTLSERADILIKIQERLRKLFRRDVIIEWDAGNLRITFARLDIQSKPYSSGREASGLLHLLGILIALYDDEVGAVLIDEPEVSLHPQLQAFVLKEIIGVSGYPTAASNKKIVVIATHSTEMLRIEKVEDLLSLVFCYDFDADPVQISPAAGELKNRKLQSLIPRLGQEHKLSFFATRPLLLEGASDSIICAGLASKLHIYLEAGGSQLLPVVGKGQMSVVAKLMRLFGKEPVALADADAIADGLELIQLFLANNQEADKKAAKLGFSSAMQMASGIYSDFCKVVTNQWDAIASVAEKHPYWINGASIDLEVAKRRAAFCALFELTDSSLQAMDPSNNWLLIKSRISSLLEFLAQFGCFILRLGTIESYYQKSDRLSSIGKPAAAAEEIEHLEQVSDDQATNAYADVVRCMQYAAKTQEISEAEALRDILLAIVAPTLARVKSGATTQDAQILARGLLGDRARIFEFEVLDQSLRISMKSQILDVKGFPMTLKPSDNILDRVNTALAIGR